MFLRRGSVALVVPVALGCGGAPPPSANIADAAIAPVAGEVEDGALPDGPPDLLIATLRVAHPKTSATEVLSVLGVDYDWHAALEAEAGDLVRLVAFDASFDAVLSMDRRAPIDDPKLLYAVSVPLTSFEDALAAARKEGSVRSVRPGVYRVSKPTDHAPCDLWPSVGDAPARLVCGGGDRDVAEIGPWLARGLPKVPADPADIALTMELGPLKNRFLPELRAMVDEAAEGATAVLAGELGTTDPVLLDAPRHVLLESLRFVEDADAMRVFADVDAGAHTASFGGELRFVGSQSWLTTVLTERTGPAGPPEITWHVPKDATSVQFGHSADPAHYRGIRRVADRATALLLDRAPLSPADRQAIVAFVNGAPASRGAWVTAQGVLTPPGKSPPMRAKGPGKTAPRTPREAVEALTRLVDGYVGWTVVGIDDPARGYVQWMDQGHDVLVRLERVGRGLIAGLEPEAAKLIPTIRFSRKPAGLPAGSATLELELEVDSELAWPLVSEVGEDGEPVPPLPKGPKARATIVLTIAAVPDGPDRTWLGVSTDGKVLRDKLATALRAAPAQATLRTRADLEPLRASGASFGGFATWGTTVRSMLDSLPDVGASAAPGAPGTDERFDVALRAGLDSLPHQGMTPILVLGDAGPDPHPHYRFELRLQKGTMEDLAATVQILRDHDWDGLLGDLEKDIAPD